MLNDLVGGQVQMGFYAINGTLQHVTRLNAAFRTALASPEVRDGFWAQGTTIVGSTPEEAAKFLRSELEKYAQLVKRAGMKID